MKNDWLVPLADFEAALDSTGAAVGLRHGTMRVILYRPIGKDEQQPHKQDEVYIIISGSGTFLKGAKVRDFRTGDVIFVEAGAVHRFESFTEDFATWVVFWGPAGGEKDER